MINSTDYFLYLPLLPQVGAGLVEPPHICVSLLSRMPKVQFLTRPGEICGMTAQHAQRQGKQVARNVAASLGTGKARPYKHHDLGFVVDLGGLAAAANPLNIPSRIGTAQPGPTAVADMDRAGYLARRRRSS